MTNLIANEKKKQLKIFFNKTLLDIVFHCKQSHTMVKLAIFLVLIAPAIQRQILNFESIKSNNIQIKKIGVFVMF